MNFSSQDYVAHDEEDNNDETVLFSEVVENESNKTECELAKEKEMKNFEDYGAYEEVEYDGQHTLGSRYVLTRKDDGSIKARFVVKGFQEKYKSQADSPTASRESLKLYLSIVANER